MKRIDVASSRANAETEREGAMEEREGGGGGAEKRNVKQGRNGGEEGGRHPCLLTQMYGVLRTCHHYTSTSYGVLEASLSSQRVPGEDLFLPGVKGALTLLRGV